MKLKNLLTTLLPVAALSLCVTAQAAPITGQGTWETTLQARDLDGDTITDAFYDTALNITWLRNANVNGWMSWNTANTWANNFSFGGYDDWRLPTMVDTGAAGCDLSFAGGTDCGFNIQTATSEMAHLFHVSLGNKSYCTPDNVHCVEQPGWGLTNTGNFESLLPYLYWTGVEYAPAAGYAWSFNNYFGIQYYDVRGNPLYALAVRPGDVTGATVPEPTALLLTALGLAGLSVSRKRQSVSTSANA
jgi:hypothetical protein